MNQVSKNRINQIKTVLQNTDPEELKKVISRINDWTKAILLAARPQNDKKNKLKKGD